MTEALAGKVRAYILAGGASSRMGVNKAFISIGGRTFLERIADSLETSFGNRASIVVSPRNHEEFREWEIYFPILQDSVEGLGPISGVQSALSVNDLSYTAITAIDMPLIKPGVFIGLAERLIDSGKDATCLRINGRIEPLPSVYRTDICRKLLNSGLDKSDIFSPSYLIDRLDTLVVDLKELEPDLLSMENINEPDDLARVTERLKSSD